MPELIEPMQDDVIEEEQLNDLLYKSEDDVKQPSNIKLWWQSIQKPKVTHVKGQTRTAILEKHISTSKLVLYFWLVVYYAAYVPLTIVMMLQKKDYAKISNS